MLKDKTMKKKRDNLNLFKDRTGEIGVNSYGSRMEIVEYKGCHQVKVRFDNGYEKYCKYTSFKNGLVLSPYERRLCGVGFIGEGYDISCNGEPTKPYIYWLSMIRRCYDKEALKRRPTYLNCSVCEEWHNFQNFAKWYDNYYYEIENEVMCLDKDILVKGNKIYSPESCVFVPTCINGLFVKCNSRRGSYPVGVSFSKGNNRYLAQCSYKKVQTNLGCFDTVEDAFYKGYKPFKEAYIYEVANSYKDKIPKKLYEAMTSYQVEIGD